MSPQLGGKCPDGRPHKWQKVDDYRQYLRHYQVWQCVNCGVEKRIEVPKVD